LETEIPPVKTEKRRAAADNRRRPRFPESAPRMTWSGLAGPDPHVAVIGLGYVGLPLALHLARRRLRVTGVDVDAGRCAAINAGRSYIGHVPAGEVAAARASGRLAASVELAVAADADAFILCVPTPLTAAREPDLQHVIAAGRQVAAHLKPGRLVVLESTTYPGTTDEVLRPALEQSGLVAGRDFHLAYSPERIDPGSAGRGVAEVPRVLGGLTPACREAAAALYARAGIRTVAVSSTRTAEAVKLLENVFRAVNIALVNELKTVFDAMGLDVWEIVAAAAGKPFGFLPFTPGPGWGGHCVPVDPFYLAWKARQFGVRSRFVELAGAVNAEMPAYVVSRLTAALAARGRVLAGSAILLVGLAYKRDVDDVRESPAFAIWSLLEAAGATVEYHDPLVPAVPPTRDHGRLAGRRSIEPTPANLARFAAAVIVTDHSSVDYRALVAGSSLVIDTRDACRRRGPGDDGEKVVRA
jgi:UDP-N-acetyl-D-glucosamine dehydrogenase